jgi:hypothetical protein
VYISADYLELYHFNIQLDKVFEIVSQIENIYLHVLDVFVFILKLEYFN